MRCIATLLTLALCAVTNAAEPLARSRQCLVVVGDSWQSTTGIMSMFERETKRSPWRRRGSPIDVRLGRAGLAWGRGLIDVTSFQGQIKREGDDKAPAGIFHLASVFGSRQKTRMPFVQVSANVVAVDDPHSRYYNRLVDQSKIRTRDWKHAEKMSGVELYKCGVFVDHNVPPKPGAGSCIFLHIWKSPTTSTSGCTAMSERNLVDLIHWLDPAQAPVLVQLPRPVYDELRDEWKLP